METTKTFQIKTIDPKNTWVAIDLVSGEIIAEGKNSKEVEEISDKLGKNYMVSFVPKTGTGYIL